MSRSSARNSPPPPLVEVDACILQAGDTIAVFSGRRTGERRTKIVRAWQSGGHVHIDTSSCGRLILSPNATVRAEVPR